MPSVQFITDDSNLDQAEIVFARLVHHKVTFFLLHDLCLGKEAPSPATFKDRHREVSEISFQVLDKMSSM
jgi:hypothetical protein